ncbi:hypothetical protein DB346_20525 [Verrucomicrobia bacterium LW23]|nr:hypothetical protein DB346_20525 [Verrucomicrobia bacterium LW23]
MEAGICINVFTTMRLTFAILLACLAFGFAPVTATPAQAGIVVDLGPVRIVGGRDYYDRRYYYGRPYYRPYRPYGYYRRGGYYYGRPYPYRYYRGNGYYHRHYRHW